VNAKVKQADSLIERYKVTSTPSVVVNGKYVTAGTMAGSYEALFRRRAIKYKQQGLKDIPLKEKDYRDLILKEYTLLKRPVVINGKEIFIGSEKKTVDQLKKIK